MNAMTQSVNLAWFSVFASAELFLATMEWLCSLQYVKQVTFLSLHSLSLKAYQETNSIVKEQIPNFLECK